MGTAVFLLYMRFRLCASVSDSILLWRQIHHYGVQKRIYRTTDQNIETTKTETKQFPPHNNFKHPMMTVSVETYSLI
jgi:hypothetical protein